MTAAGLVLFAAVPASAAEIRAVFVGIDTYLYSRARVPDAGFDDLRAAVADVARFKQALAGAYGLDLDKPDGEGCRSANAVSITLTDRCATRQAMLSALDDRIDASAPGDTLLFYFAGHGGRYSDDQVFDQALGTNVSIMPADAREPGAIAAADILDREIRMIADRATAKGVNIVTIFDSCHSGTGQRLVIAAPEGEARGGAPILTIPAVPPPPAALPVSGTPGYRVHLGASTDLEEAREVVRPESRGGVFTMALAETIAQMPHSTFGDIADEVRLKVIERGHGRQTPQAEGALNATFGGAHRGGTLLSASSGSGGVTVGAGRLSGIAEGSTFDLYANATDALAGKAPLATGRIGGVDPSTSTLVIDQPPSAPLPERLFARQTAQGAGTSQLTVRIEEAVGDFGKPTIDAVAALPFVRIAEPAQVRVTFFGLSTRLITADASTIAELGDPNEPATVAAVAEVLRRVEKVNALLALRTSPSEADASFCLAGGEHDPFACAAPEALAAPPPEAGKPAQLTVVNRSDEPRYIYVLSIDEQYGITLVMPPLGGTDPAVGPHQPLQRPIVPAAAGLFRFITIATDAPIDAAAFEQEGIVQDPRRGDGCSASIEPARCSAASGGREQSAPRVGKWSVTAVAVTVARGKT